MKLSSFWFVFLTFCGVFRIDNAETLKCEFKIHWSIYSCKVTSLDNTNNSMVITDYSGIHDPNTQTDTDVKRIWIRDTNTKYIPKNLGFLFNLNVLRMINIQLVEIKSQDFDGMQDLKELTLSDNRLTSFPIDVFSTLTKLKIIDLGLNHIEEIPNGVFSNNLQLKTIYLYGNKIKFLGSLLFDGLSKLKFVVLWDNVCINKRFPGITEIMQLKNDIKRKCKNPNEVPATTTKNTTDFSSTNF